MNSSHGSSSSPRLRSISQPYDPRSTLGIAPSRKLPPTPLNLSPSPPGNSYYGRVYTQDETSTPRTASTTTSSFNSAYAGISDDESFGLYTPRTPSIHNSYQSSGFPSPALSSASSAYGRERMSSAGSTHGSMSRGKSPVKVMFADEPVSRVHTPSSASSASMGGNRQSSSGSGGGSKIKEFFGGWKRKTTGPNVVSNAGEMEASRSSLSLGRFGQGDRSPVFGSPGPAPGSEGRFGSPQPFPSPSGSGVASGSFHRERDVKNENKERGVQSMYLPQQTPVRSFSTGLYEGRSVEPVYPRPAPRSARSINENSVPPPTDFSRQRRRTTSGLTTLDPMGSMSVSSPLATTNNRKTSVVQRSESSFSVHSESGVETWCESPSYFPSSRSSEDSHEDAIEDEEEEKARVGVHRGTTFADLAKKRQLISQNPRISIVLPGSSFNLGLDFGLPGSESTQRGGSTLASLIEDEENASASTSSPWVQKQTELDARIVKTGLNPTTPVFSTGWDESVRHTASAGRTVTRSSTRSSRKSATKTRASSPPPLVKSPTETVRGASSPGMAT